MRDQIDGDKRFENPLVDGKGVKVVEIVPVNNHGDKLIGQDKGNNQPRNRHHHIIAQIAYHGENPGVPCRRSLPHFPRYLPDLCVDLVKHPAEIA